MAAPAPLVAPACSEGGEMETPEAAIIASPPKGGVPKGGVVGCVAARASAAARRCCVLGAPE